MKAFLIATMIFLSFAWATDTNASAKSLTTKVDLTQKHLKEQMEREKRYAKEQKFYEGKEYNLSEHQVDPKLVEKVPVIEPDYDFDITDVYRDDEENVTY